VSSEQSTSPSKVDLLNPDKAEATPMDQFRDFQSFITEQFESLSSKVEKLEQANGMQVEYAPIKTIEKMQRKLN
jgi:hypothetical protein